DRNGCREAFAQGLQPVVRPPDGPDVHHVREPTGKYERTEQPGNPIERGISPLAQEREDRQWNREIGGRDECVRRHHRPQQARVPGKTVAMGQVPLAAEERSDLIHDRYLRCGFIVLPRRWSLRLKLSSTGSRASDAHDDRMALAWMIARAI